MKNSRKKPPVQHNPVTFRNIFPISRAEKGIFGLADKDIEKVVREYEDTVKKQDSEIGDFRAIAKILGL